MNEIFVTPPNAWRGEREREERERDSLYLTLHISLNLRETFSLCLWQFLTAVAAHNLYAWFGVDATPPAATAAAVASAAATGCPSVCSGFLMTLKYCVATFALLSSPQLLAAQVPRAPRPVAHLMQELLLLLLLLPLLLILVLLLLALHLLLAFLSHLDAAMIAECSPALYLKRLSFRPKQRAVAQHSISSVYNLVNNF